MSVVSPVIRSLTSNTRLRHDFPDAAQFEGKADGIDVERRPLMVAHPNEDGRQGAGQRHRALAPDIVGFSRGRLAKRARQHLADRGGVAD
jgi:hypothetical protein